MWTCRLSCATGLKARDLDFVSFSSLVFLGDRFLFHVCFAPGLHALALFRPVGLTLDRTRSTQTYSQNRSVLELVGTSMTTTHLSTL